MLFQKLRYALNAISKLFLTRVFTLLTRARFHYYGIRFGKNLRSTGSPYLNTHWSSQIVIGDNCKINSGGIINPVGNYRKTSIYVGPNAKLSIGNNVGISNTTLVCLGSIEVEDRVYIGGGCNIYDTDFHSLDPALRGTLKDKPKIAPIILKAGCFVGGHTIILKGVVIGEGAVIGAGSVVTGTVPDWEIWAGNPAKRIADINQRIQQDS